METFLGFTQHFHQDVHLVHSTLAEAVSDYVASTPVEEVKELASFISNALETMSDKELDALWDKSRSDLFFAEGETRPVLQEVLRVLTALKSSL